MNSAIASRTGGYEGIGFAIPATIAKAVMENIIQNKRVVRGGLGISLADAPVTTKGQRRQGVLVASVVDGSPAEKAGIREGDIMFIPPGPEYPHQILNTSDKPLKYLSFSINAEADICEYPDSGKYLAYSRTKGPLLDGGRMHRVKDDLDYWDGEA